MPAAPSPWPLTPFESLMWHDQRSGYPMTFYMEAEFSGTLDKKALQAAANSAITRHPLLRASVERRSGRWHWNLPEARPCPVACPDGAPSQWDTTWEVIDLRRTGGVRLIAQAEAERSRLIGVFHHAATDGIGALLFLGDLLATYHSLLAGPAHEPVAFDWDEAGLIHRGDSDWGRRARQAPADQPPAAPVPRGVILNEALEFLTLSPLRLTPQGGNRGRAADRSAQEPPYARTFVAAPVFQRLRALASASGVQLNDLLLREMVLAILDWQAEQGHAAPRRGAVRITMPVNLRSEGHRRLPAANILSYGFVHSRPSEWNDPRSLLGSISGQTRAIVDQGWPQVFLTGLGIAQQVPGLLPLILSLSRSFATLVFSNLGDVVRRMRFRPPLVDGKLTAGNVTMERITLVPPVRPGTRLAMAAATYNGTLSLSTQGCPRTFGLEGAEMFQTLFVRRLTRLAELTASQ